MSEVWIPVGPVHTAIVHFLPGETGVRLPTAVELLGGTTFINPEQKVLEPLHLQSFVLYCLGMKPPEVAPRLNRSEAAVSKEREELIDALAARTMAHAVTLGFEKADIFHIKTPAIFTRRSVSVGLQSVLQRLACGDTPAETANQLGISVASVKNSYRTLSHSSGLPSPLRDPTPIVLAANMSGLIKPTVSST